MTRPRIVVTILLTGALAAVNLATVEAGFLSRAVQQQDEIPLTAPAPQSSSSYPPAEPAYGPPAAHAQHVAPTKKISYRHHRPLLGRSCRQVETYETVLMVEDPCTGCVHPVPVCLPLCCQEAPEVCPREGILGRRMVNYDWNCCDYRIKVMFRTRGDIVVHYYER